MLTAIRSTGFKQWRAHPDKTPSPWIRVIGIEDRGRGPTRVVTDTGQVMDRLFELEFAARSLSICHCKIPREILDIRVKIINHDTRMQEKLLTLKIDESPKAKQLLSIF